MMKRMSAIFLILLFFAGSANAQMGSTQFFDEVNGLLTRHIHDSLVDYKSIKENPEKVQKIVTALRQFDLNSLSNANDEMAFWINAYNILVIHAVVSHYPIKTPMDVKGFFDTQKHQVAGEPLTLNEIENEKLRAKFQDPRIHFALVCAAHSCPPIIDQAYIGKKLDEQLDGRTRANLNDDVFIRVRANEKKVYISKIFKWYKKDFVNEEKTVLQYINQYRSDKIPGSFTVDFYEYDWSLNEYKETKTGHLITETDNLQAYTPSTLLLPGQIELKQFNNLYTQTAFFNSDGDRVDLNERATFFTGITNFFYGFRLNINLGFDLYFRSVRYDQESSSPFSVFRFSSNENARTALSSFAPKIKIAPFAKLRNLAIQTLVLIPLASGLEDMPFLDFDNVQWWTQFFYDRLLSSKFLLYLENGLFLRFDSDGTVYRTPFKGILNFYPSNKWTLYLPTELAPTWDGLSWSEYYFQAGLGTKYQLTPNLELEALYTKFFEGKQSGAGVTYNLGLRIIR